MVQVILITGQVYVLEQLVSDVAKACTEQVVLITW